VTSKSNPAQEFGRDVLGPIVAEFCLRLWSLGSLMERRDDTAFLFCARGGLRMQLAYEHFVAASGLSSPLYAAPLMVSRLVAVRPALMLTVDGHLDSLAQSAAVTLAYEFPRSSLSEVAVALTSVAPPEIGGEWSATFTPQGFARLLRHSDGVRVVRALSDQADLFRRHLRSALQGRHHAVLVDTGLYGTTPGLMAEGMPGIDFSSALLARSYRPGLDHSNSKTVGLSVEARDYSPFRRRSALLRHWHFVEWLFEPEVESVRTFGYENGVLRSNLEVDGWQDHLMPTPGSAFAGVIDYLDNLPAGPAGKITKDVDRAWDKFHRSVVWPNRTAGQALLVGTRSHDFGTDGTWAPREWKGPVAALRGSTMWREGEIARSGSLLRMPMLAMIELAYGARQVKRHLL